ncbi:MAG: hypothetical protein ACTSWY_02105, partial [Promethearchaeota archaeon]
YMSSLDLLMRYEEKAKGTKAGMFEGFIGLGSAGAPIIAGLLATIYLTLPFIILSIIIMLICLINLYLGKDIEKE